MVAIGQKGQQPIQVAEFPPIPPEDYPPLKFASTDQILGIGWGWNAIKKNR